MLSLCRRCAFQPSLFAPFVKLDLELHEKGDHFGTGLYIEFTALPIISRGRKMAQIPRW